MDTILLIGHLGSIGRRYAAILNFLKHPWIGFDTQEGKPFPKPDSYTKAIIAVPTPKHWDVALEMIKHRKTFLCEKPLCTSADLARVLSKEAEVFNVSGFVVNNLLILAKRIGFQKGDRVFYDHYHSGNDGLFLDCCQLLYLDPHAVLKTESPTLDMSIGDVDIPYRWIEESYISMLRAFCSDDIARLAPLSVGVEMLEAVESRYL